MNAVTSNVIAACVALAAFAVAVVAGLFSGNDAAAVLLRALLAMLVCYPVGMLIGIVCQRVIADHLRALDAAQAALEASDDGGAEQIVQSAEESEVEGHV